MPTEQEISRFNKELTEEGRVLVREATTLVVRRLAMRALELCVAVTPRRTGQLQSGWFVIEEPPNDLTGRIRDLARIPIVGSGSVLSRGNIVAARYNTVNGNVLSVYNGVFYRFAFNAARPNISIAINQFESEAGQLIQTFADRVVSAGSRFI